MVKITLERDVRHLLAISVFSLAACGHAQTSLPCAGERNISAQKVFSAWDQNGDGYISHNEWADGEQKMLKMVPESSRADALQHLEQDFQRMDLNHDGRIDFTEYTSDQDSPPDWAKPTGNHYSCRSDSKR